jgi:alpha-D-ribose 1-methylphosphonate 5-triphosphate synthase subunit PhnI
MTKIVKKTMQMNQDYIDRLRRVFGVRTDTEAVNKAMEMALIDDEIISASEVKERSSKRSFDEGFVGNLIKGGNSHDRKAQNHLVATCGDG